MNTLLIVVLFQPGQAKTEDRLLTLEEPFVKVAALTHEICKSNEKAPRQRFGKDELRAILWLKSRSVHYKDHDVSIMQVLAEFQKSFPNEADADLAYYARWFEVWHARFAR